MTEAALHKLYTTCTHAVHTAGAACLALGLATVPASAQIAPTLAEFEQRCLVPMIEVRDTVVDGLTRIPHRAAWESWVPETGAWELRRALPEAVVQFCAIHGAFGAEVDQWVAGAIASEMFEHVDRPAPAPETLQSVFIREPLIEIEIDRAVPSLTVIETNLES